MAEALGRLTEASQVDDIGEHEVRRRIVRTERARLDVGLHERRHGEPYVVGIVDEQRGKDFRRGVDLRVLGLQEATNPSRRS
jgi:hypothetical protein